jgi:ABC-type glycerol-3-phosphate transport system substrate-binding protein
MDSLVDFITYVESYTGAPLPGGERLRVDSEGSIEAMRFLQQLVYEHRLMPPRITLNEAQQLFLSGNLGIMAASGSLLAFNQSNLPYTMTVWHYPRTGRARPLITGDCLVVMKDSGVNTNTIMQVIEHLMSFDSIIRWHTHTGTPAVRTSVQDSLDLLIFYEENPNYTTPIIELGQGRIFNPSFDYLEANIVMKEALARIMLNNADPGPVLRDAQAKLDRLLEAGAGNTP